MRHLLTTIIVVAIISAAFTLMAGKCSFGYTSVEDININTLDTSTSDAKVNQTDAENSSDSVSEQIHAEYHKSPLAEYGNVKVYVDFCLEDNDHKYGDDVYAKDETYLTRFVDNKPMESMILKGPYMRLSGDGVRCRIVVGVDTVNVNIKYDSP